MAQLMVIVVVVLAVMAVLATCDDAQKYFTMTVRDGLTCEGVVLQYTRYTLGLCMPLDTYIDDQQIYSGTFSTIETSTKIFLRLNFFADEYCTDAEFVDSVEYMQVPNTCLVSLPPTPNPTPFPTADPTADPSTMPTVCPSFSPTTEPSASPSLSPWSFPPTPSPSANPSFSPSAAPTARPSPSPSALPTRGVPTTPAPTVSGRPTAGPTVSPSQVPSVRPSANPSQMPTAVPTYWIGNLDDADDVISGEHSTEYAVSASAETFVDHRGNYMMMSSPGSKCGDDTYVYLYHWNRDVTYDPICHRNSLVEILMYNTANGIETVVLNTSVSAGKTGGKGPVRCFAGSEVVTLENGESKSLSEVAVGDRILAATASGEMKYSNVIAVPHVTNNDQATFVHITTVSGNDLKVTAEHLVSVEVSCDSSKQTQLMQASEVTEGMCMASVNGLDRVAQVDSKVSHTGIYSVVAEEELIVVNGFVASPFAVNHAVSNAYYNVIRAFPMLGRFEIIRKAGEIFGRLLETFSL